MSLAEVQTPQRALALLDINAVARKWADIDPLLTEACAHSGGDFTPEIVLAGMGLHDGVERLRLLALVDGDDDDAGVLAVMVVCVSRAPSGKQVLECLLTAGSDVRAWMPFEPQMDEWARGLGCTSVRIPRGRKGWLRALAHWNLAGHVLEREI